MGYVEMRRLTPADRIEKCDSCNQDGLYTSGKEVKDRLGTVVMWFCFNCVEQTLRIDR